MCRIRCQCKIQLCVCVRPLCLSRDRDTLTPPSPPLSLPSLEIVQAASYGRAHLSPMVSDSSSGNVGRAERTQAISQRHSFQSRCGRGLLAYLPAHSHVEGVDIHSVDKRYEGVACYSSPTNSGSRPPGAIERLHCPGRVLDNQ